MKRKTGTTLCLFWYFHKQNEPQCLSYIWIMYRKKFPCIGYQGFLIYKNTIPILHPIKMITTRQNIFTRHNESTNFNFYQTFYH